MRPMLVKDARSDGCVPPTSSTNTSVGDSACTGSPPQPESNPTAAMLPAQTQGCRMNGSCQISQGTTILLRKALSTATVSPPRCRPCAE